MDPALIRLASSAITPLIKKLFVQEGPGAGLTGQRIRLSRLVSFRGEQRTLTERDVRKLAGRLVADALTVPGEPPFPPDEAQAVADALARTLLALGDLDMNDVQAVRLGHRELAGRLRGAAPAPAGLSTDAALFLESITEWACLHVLHFFTQRSTFVARTLVEQSRTQAELIAKVDALIARTPRPFAQDAAFEHRYRAYVAKKHGSLTIYGIDLHNSPDAWPLDVAYLSLEASAPETPPQADLTSVRETVNTLLAHRAAQGPRPADQALAQQARVLLRGVAGSGKTTLVQWLAVSASRSAPDERMAYLGDRVPFVLPLRTLTRHGERLPAPDRFLSAVGCPLTPPDGWADRVLTSGRGLVLVDGIDEIPEPERDRTRRWLRDLLAAYDSGNRWLVTSRPSAVRDDWLAPEGFTELTLSPMSRTGVIAFVRRWHAAAGPDAASYEQPLLDALRTKQDLARLATNPLMCGLLCALHRDRRGFLPRGRKGLYDAALDMLLARRDRERDMGDPTGVDLGEAPQIRLIQRLAYWLTINGRTEMDRSRAETIVLDAIPAIPDAAAIGRPEAVFQHLLQRSGLLREPGPGAVDFVHRTFQDYLAAKAIVDDWHVGVLTGHAGDDQWEDVIRMAVAHARPRECAEIFTELLKAADRATDRRAQLRVLFVAAAALEHATELAPDIQRALLDRTAEVIPPRTPQEARELATVGPVVLDLLPGPEGLDDEQARMVVTTATHIRSDAALPYLAQFAEHASLPVRAQLMWAWSRFDTAAYAEEVVARLGPEGLDFTVASDEQAHELMRLGLRPTRLDLRKHLSDALLSELLGHCDPAHLALEREGTSPDLSCLRPLERLETLHLDLAQEAEWSLTCLPPKAPLGFIYMREPAEEGLKGLRRYPTLDYVAGTGRLSEDDWWELAALPLLAGVSCEVGSLAFCPGTLSFPGVSYAGIGFFTDHSALHRLVTVFPAVERLGLISAVAESGVPFDVSPLADLPRLKRIDARRLRLTGTERLSPGIQIITM
ncbi:NACHT domain-containing protein [Streptomyces sp. CB03238]|uniref:NACHT domain-containing protein n=1 Tax=Streptomyces sp. CB03238 TaxID=1907777 RepID=UPI000A1109CF|nr:NACHT domain-containing protein [Streptomyces sp. CB03238]ORT58999.1 ATP-binding protein [Streptomyces sp. CB03238]